MIIQIMCMGLHDVCTVPEMNCFHMDGRTHAHTDKQIGCKTVVNKKLRSKFGLADIQDECIIIVDLME